jgi:hypothetical protein
MKIIAGMILVRITDSHIILYRKRFRKGSAFFVLITLQKKNSY